MSEEYTVLECACEQGIFSDVVYGVVLLKDYLAARTALNPDIITEFQIENPPESGFQTIDGEFLELN